MEAADMNCLISPCKKLKLVSPQKNTNTDTEPKPAMDSPHQDTQAYTEPVKEETMDDTKPDMPVIVNGEVVDKALACDIDALDSEPSEIETHIESELSAARANATGNSYSHEAEAGLNTDKDPSCETEDENIAQNDPMKNPNDSKVMWSNMYDSIAGNIANDDCEDHIKHPHGETGSVIPVRYNADQYWPGNSTGLVDSDDSDLEESDIFINVVDNLDFVTEDAINDMCTLSESNFETENAQNICSGQTRCVSLEGRENVERMFCVMGTPTCVVETELPKVDNVVEQNEAASSQNEVNKVHEIDREKLSPSISSTLFSENDRADIQPRTVQLMVLETDLDATLTNENSNHYVFKEGKQDIHETNNKDSGYVAVDEELSSDEDPSNMQPVYPLEPAVTLLPVSIRKWLHEKVEEEEDPYPIMSSFKPGSVRNQPKSGQEGEKGDDSCLIAKGGNSIPLCTSTPIVKQNGGLRNRDTNIIRSEMGEELIDKKLLKPLNELFENEKIVSNRNEEIESKVDKENLKNVADLPDKKKKSEKAHMLKRDRESKREKKKLKGTRIQKFKEYIGPGLTSNLDKENEPAVDEKKKDFVKNTDIETCTLTEYKGFGLTGPLPDKPLKASTPLPPVGLTVRNPNLVSGVNLAPRPAGTEGMILSNYGYPPSGPKVYADNTKSQTNLGSSGPHVNFAPKGSGSGQQSLTDHSSQYPSGTSSALQPDEAYPSVSSNDDRSENNSNTDKSDSLKSQKLFDPKVLQSNGQLKVSAYMNFGLLTVHVVQARQLSTKWKSACDSFVKMCLIPDDGKKPKCKTDVIQDSNNPLYDEKFSFELTDEDHCKRLMISVWHRDQSASVNEFLGCMSFGIRHLTNPKKEVSGWYYLLTEDIGRKKHLQVSHRQRPQLKVRGNHSNIPSVNKDVWGTESLQLTIKRGKNGFGFSVVEACPVRVGRVDGASPAESAGLQPGDIIVRLNRQNVSRSTATSVAKLIKHSSNTLMLELHRPKPVTLEHEENSFWQIPSSHHLADPYDNPADPYHYDDQDDLTAPQVFTIHENMKENDFPGADMTICSLNPNIASLATSTPLPLLARGHRTVQTSEVRKQEAIHRLLSLELDFIDLMHCGMQRYSRPLRHCILSHSQHTALFQNIEKLTTISEYHVKQMHDNAPSSFMSEDTDTSVTSDNHSFVLSIGMIYQSKVHMLCQAYDLYAKGIARANQILSELRHNTDFAKFVREPAGEDSQPSISAFVYRPIQHIRDLYRAVQDIFLNTNSDSADYSSLKQVVEGLQECANTITNYSNCCERVESMSSLASRDSKVSFSGSMKSRSSSSSAASSSSRGQGYKGPSCSLQSTKSADLDVMKIQDRLVFSSNVPVFQLCHDDRHLIFSGDMFKWEGHQWMKISLFLFTDMILQTVRENDGYLRVIHEPIMLRDVAAMDAQRHHGTELILYCSNGQSAKQKSSFRAPSTEQKYAWKSLIEQRVFAIRGSLEYYSSTSDVSSSSASAIVI